MNNVIKVKRSKDNKVKEAKKSFKMPSAIFILTIVIVVLIVISWIMSWSGLHYTAEKTDSEGTISHYQKHIQALGIFGIGSAIAHGFTSGSDLIFYLFVLGAFIEIAVVSGAMENGISSLIKGLNGKEILLIPLLFFIFSAAGTIFGMSEEQLALIIVIVPALAMAGFDTMTGMLIVVSGCATGVTLSTVNPFSSQIVSDSISDVIHKDILPHLLVYNFIWWLVMTIIIGSCLTFYAWRVHKNPEKTAIKKTRKESEEWISSLKNNKKENAKFTIRQKIGLSIMITTFAIMLVVFIPWKNIVGNYSTGFFDPIFGGIAILGKWKMPELAMMFIISGFIMSLVFGMPKEKTINAAWTGAKGMFGVVIVITVARGIPYILETTGMREYLIQSVTNSITSPNPIAFVYIMFIFLFFMAFFITSTSGLAAAAIPMIAKTASSLFGGPADSQTATVLGGVLIAFITSVGLVNMFTPTNPVILASMQISKIDYRDALKIIMPFTAIAFTLIVGLMIPLYFVFHIL